MTSRAASASAAAPALALLLCAQVVSACDNCVMLGKAERAMFRAHSDACLDRSRVEPELVAGLLRGELADDPALKRHVYCVLVRCKLLGKDGKLLKAPLAGKLAAGNTNTTQLQVLERCSARSADSASSPEQVAWNLLRCGYQRKALLFHYMPPASGENQPADAD